MIEITINLIAMVLSTIFGIICWTKGDIQTAILYLILVDIFDRRFCHDLDEWRKENKCVN
jgi:hypothetical protein